MVGCGRIPLLAKAGWTRHQEDGAKPPLKGADGVVAFAAEMFRRERPPHLRQRSFRRPPLSQQASSAPAESEVLTTDSCGSDYMVDVIKSLGFEYVCANPGSSFSEYAGIDHQLRERSRNQARNSLRSGRATFTSGRTIRISGGWLTSIWPLQQMVRPRCRP